MSSNSEHTKCSLLDGGGVTMPIKYRKSSQFNIFDINLKINFYAITIFLLIFSY